MKSTFKPGSSLGMIHTHKQLYKTVTLMRLHIKIYGVIYGVVIKDPTRLHQVNIIVILTLQDTVSTCKQTMIKKCNILICRWL